MAGSQIMQMSKHEASVSLAEFLELVAQPHAQPTIANVIYQLFGYSLSGSYSSTEVSSPTGKVVALPDIYAMIQKSDARRASLVKAVRALRQ